MAMALHIGDLVMIDKKYKFNKIYRDETFIDRAGCKFTANEFDGIM